MAENDPIQFTDVTVAFDGVAALRGVSFCVGRGETRILLGESGAGKSVLLKTAIGLLRPEAGEVRVLGEPVSRMTERELPGLRRRIGMVFQESALFDSINVFDNVAYRLEEEGKLGREEMEERVRTCLRFVEMEEAIGKMPDELSGGMRRRVAIARALATEPEVMLYDSPTGGLDPITASTIVELIIKLRDVNQVTSLLVTHRLQDAALASTHVWDAASGRLQVSAPAAGHTPFLVLHNGQVVFDGGLRELRDSRDPYLKQFLHGAWQSAGRNGGKPSEARS